jgi:predicted nucleotidyltransferase
MIGLPGRHFAEPVEQLDMGLMPADDSAIDMLAARLGANWENLRAARERAVDKRRALQTDLSEFNSADSSIVVFGSLGRDEFTTGSDLDWTLLVDGIADPAHLDVALAIKDKLERLRHKPPGREGVFGRLAFSHGLIHQIGGQDDTNANTTLRILLLLEAAVIGRRDAHMRVVSNILHRYLREDRGLWHGSGTFKVPRFLLNDIARYWRTMAVDFASKQRARGNEGFAMRNIKLRLSRKLIFISGLLACFSCELDLTDADKKKIYSAEAVQPLVAHLQRHLELTPLERVAATLFKFKQLDASSAKLFKAYDDFVGILADDSPLSDGKTQRQHLEDLELEDLDKDPIFDEARQISHEFRDAVHEIFLRSNTELSRLTIEYGVF